MKVEIKSHDILFLCMSLYEITRGIKKVMWTNEVCAEGILKVLFHVSVESLHVSSQIQYIACNVLLAVH